MRKSRINILIVEDDETQGKALYEAFTRDGFSAVLCATSVQAITQAQRQEFQCLMVDCMLPKMNGVDLVTEIVAMVPNKPKVFLYTGVFKDRSFNREAMKKTGAETIFLKPLDLPTVLERVNAAMIDEATVIVPPLLSLYSSQTFSDTDIVKFIEREATLHGFHLPMLYQRIHDSSLTGELTLISSSGDLSSVSFYQGNVCAVKTPDKDSYFGSLAVSRGFVSPQDVIEALRDSSGKMLGAKLIDSMSLSPHAIHVILEDQLALRLSQTVNDDVASAQWTTRKFPKPEHILDEAKLENLIEDWLESKITGDWARSALMNWGTYELEGEYHSRYHGSHTIEEVFSQPGFKGSEDALTIFRNLIRGSAFIGERGEKTKDFTFLQARVSQMAIDYKKLNYFQILGLNEKAQAREITRSYEGLKEAFDPANLPENCPKDLREKCREVFSTITRARDTLLDEVERIGYVHYLQNKRDQETLEAEPIFRTAVLELMTGHYQEAGKKLQQLLDRGFEFRDLRSYRLWAGLKEDRQYIALRLDQIPPEQRHSAPYMMAKGINYRIKGQFQKALNAYQAAHMMDPTLRMVRHEIKSLAVELQKRGSNSDLFSEINAILKKIPSSKKSA